MSSPNKSTIENKKPMVIPSAPLAANPMLPAVDSRTLRPILFSTPMVQAILQGRKTQTRRIIKPQPEPSDVSRIGGTKNYTIFKPGDVFQIKPKFNVGDILWVRETFAEWDNGGYAYKADGFIERYEAWERDTPNKFHDVERVEKWKPSLFMPKEACRLFLKVKSVKIEKLVTISPEDAECEGIEYLGGDIWKDYMNKKCFPEFMQGSTFTRTHSFQSLWQKINGEQSWYENPFVWVIEFERCVHP